jgi:hypothetical protein
MDDGNIYSFSCFICWWKFDFNMYYVTVLERCLDIIFKNNGVFVVRMSGA